MCIIGMLTLTGVYYISIVMQMRIYIYIVYIYIMPAIIIIISFIYDLII